MQGSILKLNKFPKVMEQERTCDKAKVGSQRLSSRISEGRGDQEEREVKVENGQVQKWGSLRSFCRNKL